MTVDTASSLPKTSAEPPPPPPPPEKVEPPSGRTAAERARSHTEPVQPVPKTPTLPVIGTIPRLRKIGVLGVLFEEWHKHGDVFRVKLGPQPATVVVHPDAMERVLASHRENYVKGATYNGLRQILGDGIIGLEGPAWRPRRTLLQPAFHRAGLSGLVATMARMADRYFDGLKSRYPQGGEIDAHREMTTLALDVVLNALFGPGLAKADDVSYETLGETLELVGERGNGFQLPLSVPTPGNLRFKRVLSELDEAIYKIIANARRDGAQDERGQSTLLGMLLDARDAESGEPLPDKTIRDEVLTLFVAGHETTALTLTWMFTLLQGRPDVTDKLAEEADAVLGGRVPTFDDLPALAYTRQVIDETLRLKGPVAVVARNAVHDDNLLGRQVKAGDLIMPFFYGLHRHPAFWEDPEGFDPGRFSPERSAGRDKWAYLPFSGGQRVCIGNTFSLYESTLILAMLAQRCRFAMIEGQDVRQEMIATVRPSAPVKVQVDWR